MNFWNWLGAKEKSKSEQMKEAAYQAAGNLGKIYTAREQSVFIKLVIRKLIVDNKALLEASKEESERLKIDSEHLKNLEV